MDPYHLSANDFPSIQFPTSNYCSTDGYSTTNAFSPVDVFSNMTPLSSCSVPLPSVNRILEKRKSKKTTEEDQFFPMGKPERVPKEMKELQIEMKEINRKPQFKKTRECLRVIEAGTRNQMFFTGDALHSNEIERFIKLRSYRPKKLSFNRANLQYLLENFNGAGIIFQPENLLFHNADCTDLDFEDFKLFIEQTSTHLTHFTISGTVDNVCQLAVADYIQSASNLQELEIIIETPAVLFEGQPERVLFTARNLINYFPALNKFTLHGYKSVATDVAQFAFFHLFRTSTNRRVDIYVDGDILEIRDAVKALRTDKLNKGEIMPQQIFASFTTPVKGGRLATEFTIRNLTNTITIWINDPNFGQQYEATQII